MCVPGHDPLSLIFFVLSFFSFLIGWEFYGPNYLKCKNLCTGPAHSLSPSVPAVAGHQLVIVRAAAYASDWGGGGGGVLHCFLVGANRSYVIAASDL